METTRTVSEWQCDGECGEYWETHIDIPITLDYFGTEYHLCSLECLEKWLKEKKAEEGI